MNSQRDADTVAYVSDGDEINIGIEFPPYEDPPPPYSSPKPPSVGEAPPPYESLQNNNEGEQGENSHTQPSNSRSSRHARQARHSLRENCPNVTAGLGRPRSEIPNGAHSQTYNVLESDVESTHSPLPARNVHTDGSLADNEQSSTPSENRTLGNSPSETYGFSVALARMNERMSPQSNNSTPSQVVVRLLNNSPQSTLLRNSSSDSLRNGHAAMHLSCESPNSPRGTLDRNCDSPRSTLERLIDSPRSTLERRIERPRSSIESGTCNNFLPETHEKVHSLKRNSPKTVGDQRSNSPRSLNQFIKKSESIEIRRSNDSPRHSFCMDDDVMNVSIHSNCSDSPHSSISSDHSSGRRRRKKKSSPPGALQSSDKSPKNSPRNSCVFQNASNSPRGSPRNSVLIQYNEKSPRNSMLVSPTDDNDNNRSQGGASPRNSRLCTTQDLRSINPIDVENSSKSKMALTFSSPTASPEGLAETMDLHLDNRHGHCDLVTCMCGNDKNDNIKHNSMTPEEDKTIIEFCKRAPGSKFRISPKILGIEEEVPVVGNTDIDVYHAAMEDLDGSPFSDKCNKGKLAQKLFRDSPSPLEDDGKVKCRRRVPPMDLDLPGPADQALGASPQSKFQSCEKEAAEAPMHQRQWKDLKQDSLEQSTSKENTPMDDSEIDYVHTRLSPGGSSLNSSNGVPRLFAQSPLTPSPLSPLRPLPLPRSNSVTSQISQFSVCSETGETKKKRGGSIIRSDAPYYPLSPQALPINNLAPINQGLEELINSANAMSPIRPTATEPDGNVGHVNGNEAAAAEEDAAVKPSGGGTENEILRSESLRSKKDNHKVRRTLSGNSGTPLVDTRQDDEPQDSERTFPRRPKKKKSKSPSLPVTELLGSATEPILAPEESGNLEARRKSHRLSRSPERLRKMKAWTNINNTNNAKFKQYGFIDDPDVLPARELPSASFPLGSGSQNGRSRSQERGKNRDSSRERSRDRNSKKGVSPERQKRRRSRLTDSSDHQGAIAMAVNGIRGDLSPTDTNGYRGERSGRTNLHSPKIHKSRQNGDHSMPAESLVNSDPGEFLHMNGQNGEPDHSASAGNRFSYHPRMRHRSRSREKRNRENRRSMPAMHHDSQNK